ncbi:MAG: hypothetical protein HUU48_00305 [Flavobacteriales bacterium]|nr:hypothetical protein [Flavobacteriales bacterium]
MKKIITKTAEFSLDKRGFLKIVFLNNTEDIDESEVNIHIKAAGEIAGYSKLAVLADVRLGSHSIDKKAKEMIATYNMKKAEAIIINSLAHRIIGNFYLKLSKRMNKNFPVKLFLNEKEAIQWLLTYV